MTTSASRSVVGSPTPTVRKPPARAATIPFGLSSKTMLRSGSTPSNCAARRNTSGSGLPRVVVFASTTAPKYERSPRRVSTASPLRLLLPSPIATSDGILSRNSSTPGKRSVSFSCSTYCPKYRSLSCNFSVRYAGDRKRPAHCTISSSVSRAVTPLSCA